MEKSWNALGVCLGLLNCELSYGFPINLENSLTDSHTQFLTGLVAVLLTACSIVFLAGCLCCQRKSGFKEFRNSAVNDSVRAEVDHGHVNAIANGEFTIFTPLSPPHQNNNIFLANQQARTQETSSFFDGNESDFPRSKVKYIKEIGKGWFGKVVEGTAQCTVDQENDRKPVVVRILEASASNQEKTTFLHDAAIYQCGTHPNILSLLGRCFDTIPLLLLQEHCPEGDLKRYLRQHSATANKLLSTEYPLIWCCQLTSALKHIHNSKLIHPDLAARNCQLSSDLTLKLGDYGLAVFQYPEDYYEGLPGFPLRWRAPETVSYTSTTVEPKQNTTEANIWSLAVTMWEICSCGDQPYSDLNDDEVISKVLGPTKLRLGKPSCQVIYTDYMYRLVQLCWSDEESRPAITQIDLMLTDLLQVYKNTWCNQAEPRVSDKDFDERWKSFKSNNIVKTDNHVLAINSLDLHQHVLSSSKVRSPSLNNLHGSLDDLLQNSAPQTNLEFKLGPINSSSETDLTHQTDVLFLKQISSGSDTEEENWKSKIERGVYSEKVRQKSRSVADLMTLTHIDNSESESETPLPSIDFRSNYKNVAYAPKSNYENAGLKFGSEGNLLSLQNTFQDELKKLMEEKKDHLLVPKSEYSHIICISEPTNCAASNNLSCVTTSDVANSDIPEDNRDKSNCPDEGKIIENFDSPVSPATECDNMKLESDVNNSSISIRMDSLESLNSSCKSDELNEQTDELLCVNPEVIIEQGPSNEIVGNCAREKEFNVPKLPSPEEIVEALNQYLIDNATDLSEDLPDIYQKVSEDKTDIDQECNNNLSNKIARRKEELFEVPTLADLIQNNDDLMDYIIAKYESQNLNKSDDSIDSLEEVEIDGALNQNVPGKLFQVPKLVDLIQDNDNLMDYIITRYESQNLTKSGDNVSSSEDLGDLSQEVVFDLSENQVKAMPNVLTHSSAPFAKKSLQETIPREDAYSSLNLCADSSPERDIENLYSLETWDHFLGKACDQSDSQDLFDSFSSEPQSLLFIENERDKSSAVDGILAEEEANNQDDGKWESRGGWFLHPQSNSGDISGEMTVAPSTSSGTYIGFNVDDEIMAAIRTELLNKLPQAQGAAHGTVDDEEWESTERNEVFLRYNIYNTPLSPIPEEMVLEDNSGETTPRREQSEDDDSDWLESCEPEILRVDETVESTHQGPLHRHTPSQDSCCSNDTLFNLEELTCAVVDAETSHSPTLHKEQSVTFENVNSESGKLSEFSDKDTETESKTYCEGSNCNDNANCESTRETEEIAKDECIVDISEQPTVNVEVSEPETSSDNLSFVTKQSAPPLPSPEDKPWKQLPASLLSYDKVISQNSLIPCISNNVVIESSYDGVGKEKGYQNLPDIQDILNEDEYVNIVNLENSKNSSELINDQNSDNCDIGDYGQEDQRESDIFGVLTDIRFNGPADSQLMSTSFSESNDLNDQDWDSGSDSVSSSSGEFIWKEGEHEESLKTLRAAPHDMLEDVKSAETTSSENSESDDEEGECPEFVPSAWDKYATPLKSALRSSEKSDQKKKKVVWFKKQKYHCVYEYPREPDSPVLRSPAMNNISLWESPQDYAIFGGESDLDDEFLISSSTRPFDAVGGLNNSQFFPGAWMVNQSENATPDSGVEDIQTPDNKEMKQFSQIKTVHSLKHLASAAMKLNARNAKKCEELGGLRHTRDRLKLDIPTSPSAFTSNKIFTIEKPYEPDLPREKATFTTFGKSRFLVQHVDTPPDNDDQIKNVSFEALPYKPIHNEIIFDYKADKKQTESVRGEASLLDSPDEDSGIESSTLERKLSNAIE